MPFIEFSDVRKTYRMGDVEVHAVDGMDFSIERGELCVIVGPSGAGKTTVLNMLGGMDTVTSGTITLDVAREALSFFEIDELGLDWMDVKVLRALTQTFGGRPVGLSTISAAVGEDASTLEDVYEPYLLQRGLMVRTPQGRKATPAAFEHLGVPMPHEKV